MDNQHHALGLDLPNAFPADIYHEIHRITADMFADKHLHSEWNFAWNCVANRFMIAVECRDNFSHLLKGPHSHQVRYLQEKELFVFYCASVSCVESLCYSILALINMIDPSLGNFKGEYAKKHNKPDLLVQELDRIFPEDHLTRAIKRLVISSDFEDLRNKRAVLFHRQSPGRIVGIDHEEWLLDGVTIDDNLLGDKVNFLSKRLHAVFISLRDLAALKFTRAV
jgi:hypothetical protein